MKHLLIFISLFSIIFFGCNKEDNPIKTQIDNRISFEINFLQYSDNNYFLDKVYADTSTEHNIYNHFYGNIPPIVSQKYFIKNIEVYKSINNVSETSESIIAHAYIDLPPRSSSKLYSDSYRSNN